MKTTSKILIAAVFFSLALAAACAYAQETDATGTATVPEVVSEPAPAAPAVAEKTTLENLQAAFTGEKNAHARYLAFAKKADEEGYGKAASLFRAAARAERVHFERHAKIIRKMGAVAKPDLEKPVVKSTAENLQAAFDGETYEYTRMYPEFLAKAQLDKNEDAADAFEDAGKAEAVHAALYKKVLENLQEWKGKSKKFYVCTFCGNVVDKVDFKKCPICGKSKDLYVLAR